MENVTLSTVGDCSAGKTLLLVSYTSNYVYQEYKPTVLNYYNTYLKVGTSVVDLTIWDNSGSADYDDLRPLSFPHVDGFLVCFSLKSRSSFVNVRRKWIPEINQHVKDPTIVLVGCKRDDSVMGDKDDVISVVEGEDLARAVGAVKYVETSAFERSGFTDCFNTAIKAVLSKRRRSLYKANTTSTVYSLIGI